MPQGAHEQVPVGDRAVDRRPFQGAGEAADGLRAGGRVGDRLGEHRVVVDADVVAVGAAGVQADAVGDGEAVQAAGLRGPAVRRVLGVQAGLDGVAPRGRGVGLQGVALGDPQLEGDEVDAEDRLRDRVLHLEAGVHLQEVRPAVGVHQELDGPGADVGDGAGRADGRLAQLGVEPGAQARRRRLLDHLLVAALE